MILYTQGSYGVARTVRKVPKNPRTIIGARIHFTYYVDAASGEPEEQPAARLARLTFALMESAERPV